MAQAEKDLIIRECTTIQELSKCVELQREVFALPELEISPVRHFIVTRNAGGYTLGAFSAGELIGFVLSVPAYLRGQRAFYSHMTAVRAGHQGAGVGARLKWAQRERALSEAVKYIKWTFEPVKARNAFFNLEKLGAVVRELQENFYGTDYSTEPIHGEKIGLASDRLFAEWELESPKVRSLAAGDEYVDLKRPVRSIVIPADWYGFVAADAKKALSEQLRIRSEFQTAFTAGQVCRGFARSETKPEFLLFED